VSKDLDEWRKHVRDNFGGGAVDLELDEPNVDAAIRRAVQAFSRFKPHVRWLNLGYIGTGATTTFTLTEDEVGIIGVLDVELADEDYGAIAGPTTVSTRLELYWGRRGPRLFFKAETTQRRMERMTGTQPDWWWDSEDRVLYISNHTRALKAMALFCRARAKGGTDIRYDEEDQFEDLAVGHAKLIAAEIYEQAGEIPGPQGSIGSAAARWRDEGNRMVERVMNELRNSLRGSPPPKWVG
jgi:hypothetical protein